MKEIALRKTKSFSRWVLFLCRALFFILAGFHGFFLWMTIWDWNSYQKWPILTVMECAAWGGLGLAFFLFFFDNRQRFSPFPNRWSTKRMLLMVALTLLATVALRPLNRAAFVLLAPIVFQFYVFALIFLIFKKRWPSVAPLSGRRTIIAFLCFVLAGAAFVEAESRIGWFGLFRPDERFGYALRENCWYGVNEAEYRGPRAALPKPSGVHRLLFLGDSSIFGAGVPFDRTVAQQTVDCLNRTGSVKYDSVNTGVPGYNLLQMLWRWEAFDSYEPDVIVVMADYHYQGIKESMRREMVRGQVQYIQRWLKTSQRLGLIFPTALGSIYAAVLVSGSNEPPEREANLELFRQTLQAMEEQARALKKPWIVVIYPTIPRSDPMQKVILNFVTTHGVPFVDLTENFARDMHRLTLLDELHPNEAGHGEIAQALCRLISETPSPP